MSPAATIQLLATTAATFAELKIVNASGTITALAPSQVTNQGNKTALLNFLNQATQDLQKGKISSAISKLQNAIARTDGYVLRGAVDGNGPSRDWITDPAAQVQVYGPLKAALDALVP